MPQSKYSVDNIVKQDKERLKILLWYREMIKEEGFDYFIEYIENEIDVLMQNTEDELGLETGDGIYEYVTGKEIK